MALTEAEQQSLIEDAIAQLQLGFPVGWVLLVETIDEDGDRTLHRRYTDGISPWTYRGYLSSALSEEEWEDAD